MEWLVIVWLVLEIGTFQLTGKICHNVYILMKFVNAA